jgi:dihydrolipoamide dehydrogenase
MASKPVERVQAEGPLVTLQSDKASMEIPAPQAGVVCAMRVALEDHVSEGSPIVRLEVGEAAASRAAPAAAQSGGAPAAAQSGAAGDAATAAAAQTPARAAAAPAELHAEVLVLGAGPGGYTAAFRAADLGKRAVLVERYPRLGGVCLNVGCIPSKALLHVAEVMTAAAELGAHGVAFGTPQIDFARLRAHKNEVVDKLTGGLAKLAAQRKVEVLTGAGRFASARRLEVETAEGARSVSFDCAIIATGSRSVQLPGFPSDDPRVMDSTDALEIDGAPPRLLVIGGGIIGLEMASLYDALGSSVSVVEMLPALLSGTDPDLVRPLQRRIARRYAGIHLETQVTRVEARADGLRVSFEGPKAPAAETFDRVLVAVGRRPNTDGLDAERAGVTLGERGFVAVDAQQRTNVPHIFAIGDVTGPPLLAHKATHEGKTAAEVIAGLPAAFDARAIPSVAYTDPEIAWTGLTEAQAKQRGVAVEKTTLHWAASGRALGVGRSEGLTKLLFARDTGRLAGAGIVGIHAGELIAEATLALELGADAEDLALSIHAHPTLSETLGFAAEMAAGTITDLYVPRKRR